MRGLIGRTAQESQWGRPLGELGRTLFPLLCFIFLLKSGTGRFSRSYAGNLNSFALRVLPLIVSYTLVSYTHKSIIINRWKRCQNR